MDEKDTTVIRAILRFAALTFVEVQTLRLLLIQNGVIGNHEMNQARELLLGSLAPFLGSLDRADAEQIETMLREFQGTVQ